MKQTSWKRTWPFLLILPMMLVLCLAAGAEENRSALFSEALRSLYESRGCTVLSAAECGFSGAAVIGSEDGCFLSVMSKQDGAWRVELENPRVACEESHVYLDTDDTLILTDPFSRNDESCDQYYFKKEQEWKLSFVIRYEGGADEWNAGREYHASLSDGWLFTEEIITDENDNVLMRIPGMPLPDVLTEEEKLLSHFDGFEPPVCCTGYLTDDSMSVSDAILRRLFSALDLNGYTYADGFWQEDGLLFIADRADGARVLLCCEYTRDKAPRVTESTPLPAGTVIGIENFVSTLNLGLKDYGVSLGKNSDGTWGAKGVLSLSGEWFELGDCYASEGGLWWNASPYIGTVPWNDITKMDWSRIPESLEEARAVIDPSSWATPRNPDPKDRLHLRLEADRDSRSLGKYYNGTPLRVLKKGTEWTKVRVGNTEGYMMTKYLVFGEEINRIPTALTGKVAADAVASVFWDGETESSLIPADEAARLLITGVIGEEYYLVWEPETDRYGRIWQAELWDGNG